MATTQGRPKEYDNKTKLRLSATGKTKLQPNSDRKAIIQLFMDTKGVLTIADINARFGFDISAKSIALVRAGWLEVVK